MMWAKLDEDGTKFVTTDKIDNNQLFIIFKFLFLYLIIN